jgi:hypothetical protein
MDGYQRHSRYGGVIGYLHSHTHTTLKKKKRDGNTSIQRTRETTDVAYLQKDRMSRNDNSPERRSSDRARTGFERRHPNRSGAAAVYPPRCLHGCPSSTYMYLPTFRAETMVPECLAVIEREIC